MWVRPASLLARHLFPVGGEADDVGHVGDRIGLLVGMPLPMGGLRQHGRRFARRVLARRRHGPHHSALRRRRRVGASDGWLRPKQAINELAHHRRCGQCFPANCLDALTLTKRGMAARFIMGSAAIQRLALVRSLRH